MWCPVVFLGGEGLSPRTRVRSCGLSPGLSLGVGRRGGAVQGTVVLEAGRSVRGEVRAAFCTRVACGRALDALLRLR